LCILFLLLTDIKFSIFVITRLDSDLGPAKLVWKELLSFPILQNCVQVSCPQEWQESKQCYDQWLKKWILYFLRIMRERVLLCKTNIIVYSLHELRWDFFKTTL
jgi:hypothetical protein